MLAVYWLLLGLIFLGAGEGILRLRGHRPFQRSAMSMTVEPGGTMFRAHPQYGYIQHPGQFVVTLKGEFPFQATHGSNSLRITREPRMEKEFNSKPPLWIFGCSFTYGWSLDDSNTYPWQVQILMRDVNVINFGVNGYGTITSLRQFQSAIVTSLPPKTVVLAYSSIHEERNTLPRSRRKFMVPWSSLGPTAQPYARLNADGTLQFHLEPLEYSEVPMARHLALVNYLENHYNHREFISVHSRRVSELLVQEFATQCKQRGIRFILAGIMDDAGPMLEYCRGQGIECADISVDLNVGNFTNQPHDPHPNAAANRIYAERLVSFLKKDK